MSESFKIKARLRKAAEDVLHSQAKPIKRLLLATGRDRSPILHYDVPTWMKVMHVNVTAPFILTKTLLPLLDHADGGHRSALVWTVAESDAAAVLHFAGVNRGEDAEVEQANPRIARELAAACGLDGCAAFG